MFNSEDDHQPDPPKKFIGSGEDVVLTPLNEEKEECLESITELA